VKPARRKKSWRGLLVPLFIWVTLTPALIFGAYRSVAIAGHAHVLQVDKIAVHGNERLSKEDVVAVLSGLRGENIIWTDLEHWRTRLKASPWVRDAVMRRSLPSTVDVFVSEREPIGIGRIHSDMYLVDDRGVIIDQYGPQYADLDLPIIDGLSPAPGENGALTDEGRADLAARVIAAVKSKPVIAKRLSQVDVSDAHNASVILGGDPAMIQLGDDQFLARLQAYLDLAPALRERVADIDYVDLRFDDRIYVRPTKDGKKVRSKK